LIHVDNTLPGTLCRQSMHKQCC